MQSREHVAARADPAVDECHVMHLVERGDIGVALERADLGSDLEFRDPLDQLVAGLAIGDQVRDRNSFQAVVLGEGGDLVPARHRAVVVHQLGEHPDRRHAGEPAQVDTGFGMAGTHQDAALLGDQRKHVAGADEIAGPGVAVGERAHGVGALLGRNPGGEPMTEVDRDRECGPERRVVGGHHGIEVEALGLLDRERRANDARRVADDEGHLLRGAQRSRHEQVALVLAVVVVGDDDDLAARKGFDHRADALVDVGQCRSPTAPGTAMAAARRPGRGGANNDRR